MLTAWWPDRSISLFGCGPSLRPGLRNRSLRRAVAVKNGRVAATRRVLHEAQGRYDDAETQFKRVLASRERVIGPEHPDTLINIHNLAELYFIRRQWSDAAALWRRSTAAIAARTRRGGETPEPASRGPKRTEAEQREWQFWWLVKATYRLTSEGRSPEEAVARDMFEQAQWAISSEAARSLAQMAARGAKGDGRLAASVRERQDLVAEWQRREMLRNTALGREAANRDATAETENSMRMAAIDARISAIDQSLAAEFPDYAALANVVPLSAESVQAGLGADEALVLFLDTPRWGPTPDETFIWVVTRTNIRWIRSDLGGRALAADVLALRCGLDREQWATPSNASRCSELSGLADQPDPSQPLPFDLTRAHRIYKALFGGIEDLIKNKHLLIVSNGPLTQLPFQVLVIAPPAAADYRSAAWLIREHAITILPAVSSLKALRANSHPSTATKPLIGFGNPLLDGPDDRYAKYAALAREKQNCPKNLLQRAAALFGLRTGAQPIDMRRGLAEISRVRQLAPLPETADELCAAAHEMGAEAAEMHLGAGATERAVKTLSKSGELTRYRVVHFATHGAMAGELREGFEPGLILTPPDSASSEDDGYLSASEIAELKLDADWVILSACNTAAGDRTSAEALSGLARAFIYAQARALLVSHWAVDSSATVKLITVTMHRFARDGTIGRAEALRGAMLTLIDQSQIQEAHPAYWAPFVVVGEGAR